MADKIEFELDGDTFVGTMEEWEQLNEALQRLLEILPDKLLQYFQESKALEQYLAVELRKPKYKGRTIGELWGESHPDADGEPDPESLFMQAMTAARTARDDDARRKLQADGSVLKDNYFGMQHGKVTDLLALYDSRDAAYNEDGDAVIQTADGKANITIEGARNLRGKYGSGTHKLLSVAVSEFTKNNHYSRSRKERALNYDVHIPFIEYATACGYIKEDTQEGKAASAARKDARKKIKRELDILYNLSIEFLAPGADNNDSNDWERFRFLDSVGISNGYIHIGFTRKIGRELSRLPLMQYNRALLRIPATSPNAYRIGYKMAMHYFNDNNVIRGSYCRLKVETLLEQTDLPTMDQLKRTNHTRHWQDRIKEPLEVALDTITGTVISDWEYTRAKGEKLTDAEAANITTYEVFSDLYVQFVMIGEPEGQEERRQRRAEEKAAALAGKSTGEEKRQHKGVTTGH